MKALGAMRKYCIGLFVFATFLSDTLIAQSQNTAAPNIVLFVADDLGAVDISPYGNKIARTPNLGSFARESLLFKNAFASSPTCSPSRSSFLTGLMPFRNGAHGNHAGVKEGTRSIVQYLEPLGYQVAIAGKLHIGPESVFSFERIANTNVPEPGFEKKPGLNWDLNLDPVNTWFSKRNTNKPFMLVVADHSPHVVWPEQATYDPGKVDIPANHIDTKETRKSRARYYTDITKMDGNFGRLLRLLEQHHLKENTLVIFIADQGPQWAFAKWTLYDYGVHTPLLVRWPGITKRGQQTQALVSLVDLVPTIVEAAGGTAPAGIDGNSFLKVIKDAKQPAREMVFASHTGDGMMNRTPTRMLRTIRYKYILNIAADTIFNTHMNKARDHDGGREYWNSWKDLSFTNQHAAFVLWRYHHHPAEELYDIQADPLEQHNLSAEPRYAAMLADFRSKMKSWRAGQGDEETGPEKLIPLPAGAKPVAPYVF